MFSPDLPYPPNRGGRADIWRRILAFRALGHEVMLVNLQEDTAVQAPTPEDLAIVDGVVSSRFAFAIRRGWLVTVRQLANARAVPWHAATRVPTGAAATGLDAAIAEFKPDFIWLDGPWFGVVGCKMADRSGVPILYRSHNIEHQYIRSQAKVAVRLRDRIAWTLATIGLQRFERSVMKQAARVFDISVDDLQYWKARGIGQLHWLPPLPELAFSGQQGPAIPGDIVFVGNLGTPNNVRGVAWLVTEVMPKVREQLPTVSCRIVGSNPTPFLRQLFKANQQVELCANVASAPPYLFGARVLVNPVMTGSGVQVKMLDMLMTNAPIVTCSQGTRGLPAALRAQFRVADDAAAFAQAICEELLKPSVNLNSRLAARKAFSVSAVGEALDIAMQNPRAPT